MIVKFLPFTLLLIMIAHGLRSQDLDRTADSIVQEADLIFRADKSSQTAVQMIELVHFDSSKFHDLLSYPIDKKQRVIFYTGGNKPTVYATFDFDSTLDVLNTTYDPIKRSFSLHEQDLYNMKEAAFSFMIKNGFRATEGGDFHAVPIIDPKGKRLYIRSISLKDGRILFGNDCLLNFGPGTEISSAKYFHNEASCLDYPEPASSDLYRNIKYHLHHDGEADLMTVQDLATLRLYLAETGWRLFIVTSKKYGSIFRPKLNSLKIYTMEEYKKLPMFEDALEH